MRRDLNASTASCPSLLSEFIIKPVILGLNFLADEHCALIAHDYEFIYAPEADQRRDAIATHGSRINVVLTIGSVGLTEQEIAALPQLKLISALGAGFERIDVAAAEANRIPVTNGAGTNDVCVADHAMALLLGAVRDIAELDRLTRAGVWRTEIPVKPGVSNKRLGILGLGTIGRHIARRAQAFDMQIGYHNRRERDDAPGLTYFGSVLALAQWADFLVVATPGGAQTQHLVGAAVLKALGPKGYLVNIARGSVVDTDALAHALKTGILGGAGLDVYESEPAAPTALLDCPNLVLTPHVAGWSPEAIDATIACFLGNVERLLGKQPLQNLISRA